MSKKVNLQPWLDYFEMLQRYEEAGYLEVMVEKHEAYVTQPAVHAMSDGTNPMTQMLDGSILKTLRRLRAYAAFRSCSGNGYLDRPFALNVVSEESPHGPLYTLVISRQRRWWRLWLKGDVVETITY